MNRISLICAALVVLASCSRPSVPLQNEDAGQLKWLTNYDEAVELSKGGERNLLIEFSTQWCPYCKYIEENVFNKQEAVDELSKFVLLSIDGDKKENQAMMDRLDIKGFPTFIVMDHSGKELLRFNELGSSKEFVSIIGGIGGEGKGAGNREKELAAELEKLSGDKQALRKALLELIRDFPGSIDLPSYYHKLASTYSSSILRNSALKRSASLIEKNVSNIKKRSDAEKWIVLDQQIDLAADIYKELGMFGKIKEIYLKAGSICEKDVWTNGGVANNHYLINPISHYYSSAGAFDKAQMFMKRAMKEDPEYWPIYAGLAKALLAAGKAGEAASFAKKGYSLAEEVARPKVAFIWAECYAEKKDLVKAIEILQTAKNELQNGEGSKHGRALKIIGMLDERLDEYKNAVQQP